GGEGGRAPGGREGLAGAAGLRRSADPGFEGAGVAGQGREAAPGDPAREGAREQERVSHQRQDLGLRRVRAHVGEDRSHRGRGQHRRRAGRPYPRVDRRRPQAARALGEQLRRRRPGRAEEEARRLRGAVRAVLLLGLVPAVALANPFTPNLDSQRRYGQALMPAEIGLPTPATHPKSVAVLRIRFYADEDYRAGLFRWADRTKGQLEYLNKVVEPALGVRFEPESFRRWHRESGNIDVHQMLAELEKMDPGPGVDLVVGFVSPLPLVSTSMHEIGAARMMGRHFILRGMASADEASALKALDLLDPSEREQVYSRRKWHKETAVFLHEWLHTLGAIHSSNPERLTNPSYSNKMSNLAIVDTELAAIALRARLDERQSGTLDWSRLRGAVERSRSPEWFNKERDELLAMLISQGARAGQPPGEKRLREPEGGLSKEETESFNKAIELTKANKGEDAWNAGKALGPKYPKSVDVQRMLCRLSYVKAAGEEGLTACARAHELAPAAPEPLIDAAQARILRKEIPEALAATDAAAELATKKPDRGDVWVWIAQLYGQ